LMVCAFYERIGYANIATSHFMTKSVNDV